MKKIAQVLSIIIVITMLLGTLPVSADFADVSMSSPYYLPVNVLNAFGIINGYDDGINFGPENDVTRAEFSAMLMRALASGGIGSPDPAGTPFTDLGGATWAISDIRTAYDLKIVNGTSETTFSPLDNVTYEQALKMIVCALNYGAQADDAKASAETIQGIALPWYYGYMQVANSLKLTDGISVVLGVGAKRWEIAQMIYNALEVEMLDKVTMADGSVMYTKSEKTLLESKLGYIKSRGEIYADGTNTIAPDGKTARDGYALIRDVVDNTVYTFAKGKVSLSGLLGKSADYYYKKDNLGNKTLVAVLSTSEGTDSIVISADNIVNVTGSKASGFTVKYYETATSLRPKTATIEPNATFSFNGKVEQDPALPSATDLQIENGTIELIQAGSGITKVNVEMYETYVVRSVNTNSKSIIDVNRTSADDNVLTIDDTDSTKSITIKNLSGSAMTLSNIMPNHVLSVRRGSGNAGRETIDITVSNKNASGTLKELDISGRRMNIGGTDYKISTYLVKYGRSVLNALTIGDNYKCYLDKDGSVAYLTKTESTSMYYGYLADAIPEATNSVGFELISSKSSTVGSVYYLSASKVKIDGTVYSSKDDILEALERGVNVYDEGGNKVTNLDGHASLYSQFIRYTVNSAGEISAIETAYVGENEDPTDETLMQSYSVTRKTGNIMTYKSSNYDFIGNPSTEKFRVSSTTQVFVIPEDRSDYDLYGRKNISYFKDGRNYVIEAYGVTGTLHVASAVVVYEEQGAMEEIDSTTPLFIIKSVRQGLNPDDDEEECDIVTGYQISTSGTVTEKTYYTDELGLIYDNYRSGDVIVFTTNSKGQISRGAGGLRTLDIKFSPRDFEGGDWGEGATYVDNVKYSHVYAGLMLGSAIDSTTQMFDLALVDDALDCLTAEAKSFTTTANTTFFTYDDGEDVKDADRVVNQGTNFDLAYANAFDPENPELSAPSKVFVYKYADRVRMVYVIK